MGAVQLADFGSVDDDRAELGASVTRRRERVRATINELADAAGVNRDTLSDLEKGVKRPHASTLRKVLDALDAAEMEAFGVVGEEVPPAPSPPAPSPVAQVVTFRAQGIFGAAEVTVAGPVENTAELAEQFAKLLDNLRRQENGDD